MFAAALAFGLTLKTGEAGACHAPLTANCVTSRQLASSDDFQGELKSFVGDAKGDYRRGNRLVYKEVEMRLAMPDGSPMDLGGGAKLYPGCRRFACPEKAAVILDGAAVVAIGVLDYHSESNPTLEVLVQRSGPQAVQRARVLKTWADRAVAQDAGLTHAPLTVRGMRVRALEEEQGSAPTAYAKACSTLAKMINRCR